MRPRARTTNEEHVVRAGLGDEKIRIDSIGVVVPRRARWPGLEMQEPRTPRHPGVDSSSLHRSAAMAMRACAKHEENLDGIELESPRAFQFPRLIETGNPPSSMQYRGNCATSDDLAGCDLRGVRRGRMVK